MNKKLTLKQVLILFIIVMGVLITMATMAYNRLVSLVESTEAINRSNVFAMKLEEVISCLKDAESGSIGRNNSTPKLAGYKTRSQEIC
jgi:CHASE3 domain sensor protein